ncbi:MAG: AMP-binding protein, partial [Cutibacterium granulosum]|nr:AMP-binding protein [Cutibacterium granulosum]
MTQELAVNHLAHLFARARSQHGFRPATRVRRDGEWVLHTYAELGRRVDAIARCLVDPGFVTDDGLCRDDRISIFAHNCPEWLELDLAALTVGAIPVPIFPTSTPEQIVHIISDAQVRVLAVADKSLAQRALSVADRMPSLERIIVLDGDLPDDPAIATISFADLVAGGGLDDSGALTSDGSRWPAVASDAQPSQTARVAEQPRKGQSEPGDDRLRDERSEGSSSSDRPSAAQASTDQSADPACDVQQGHRAQLDAIVAERMDQARPDDVAALIYTSGTTGSPKGVMLTHEGVLSEIASLDAFFDFQPTDHSLCFLPL